MKITEFADGFDLALDGRLLLRHRDAAPCLFVGRGEADFRMSRGHFQVEDYVSARRPLGHAEVRRQPDGVRIAFAQSAHLPPLLEVLIESAPGRATLRLESREPHVNRLWLRLSAEAGEHVWGGGEQLSYFDLRGRRFPLWTSEPGVGRDKSTLVTYQADLAGGGGGDYFTTNYPQPTFISSRRYALHVETTAFTAFDFRHSGFHEIETWAIPQRIELWTAARFTDLVSALSSRFGRQPPLPDWVRSGAIIGLKDGDRSFERLERYVSAGAAVSGLWCEDWVGVRQTSFGTRLFWDWQFNPERYPLLDRRIAALRAFYKHQILIGARKDNPAAELSCRAAPARCRARSRPARRSG